MSKGIVMTLETSQIKVFEDQPRKYFDVNYIKELGKSILEVGQKKPIHVMDLGDGMYELIDGENRLRACTMYELNIIAIVHEKMTHNQQFLDSLTHNFFGKEHTHREKYLAVVKLIEMNLTVQQIMRTLGKSDAWVYSYLSFRKLAPELQDLLEHDPGEQCLKFEEARFLARLDDHDKQRDILAQAADLTPNRRRVYIRKQVEELVPPKPRKNRKVAKDISDHKRLVMSFIDSTAARSELIMDMPADALKTILDKLSVTEKQLWQETVEEAIINLETIKEILERECILADLRN